MVGRHAGYVPTQGLILADRFAEFHASVISTSPVTNRYLRLADMVRTLVRRRRDVDVQCLEVYSGKSFVVEDIASRLAQRFGHRIVMWLHGGGMPEFMARFPDWMRRVLSRADVLVTPSRYLARSVQALGFEARVIPNALDVSEYPYRHRHRLRPRLFWMRTFHPVWNPSMAIRVLARLRRTVPDATLVMAGQDLGSLDETRGLARSLGVAEAVRFPGFLDLGGKVKEGDWADLFINTNHVDNTPVAVAEACALGLPVVTTNIGGIPDLLRHGENGLLVADDDDDAMAAAVRRLLEDSRLAARISANNRALAESFSWDRVRPEWERLFREVAGVTA
jgi:glycosyltransferase involved in cell wall biosynthesis